MNKEFRSILQKYNMTPKKYTLKKNIFIIETDNDRIVFKKNMNNIKKLQEYLLSRNFEFFPKLINLSDNSKFLSYKYIDDIETPIEQKALDIIQLIALLHNKTTYYKEVTQDDFKKTYDNIKEKVEYIYNYYNDLVTISEKKQIMSPKEYLLCRNISKINSAINYCYNKLEKYLKDTTELKKQRIVTLHNNLSLDHIIRNNAPYLISWNKSKTDIPIYDFYIFFKNHALELDFSELFKLYNSKYPLTEEEKLLLFILISIPEKVDYDKSELKSCIKIRKMIDMLYKAENLIRKNEKIPSKS